MILNMSSLIDWRPDLGSESLRGTANRAADSPDSVEPSRSISDLFPLGSADVLDRSRRAHRGYPYLYPSRERPVDLDTVIVLAHAMADEVGDLLLLHGHRRPA